MAIGPTFGDEIAAAGLGGLPFSWTPEGLGDLSALTDTQRAAVEAVLAAHNPAASVVPASVKMWQAKAALAAAGKLEAASAVIAQVGGPIAMAWAFAPDVSRDSPGMSAIGDAIGLGPSDIDALFIAAAQIKV